MNENGKAATTRWIIALCITASFAIIGWTVTGTLVTRQKELERIKENSITLDAGTVVLLQFTGVKTTFKESDGVTWHSVIEFNFIID